MQEIDVLMKVYEPERLQRAWQQVRANAGAAGTDRMTVEAFVQREAQLLALIHDKLKSGSYRFQPARRLEIPKPGLSKTRKLGIPVVMDRIVGTSMHYVLESIFDSGFTAENPSISGFACCISACCPAVKIKRMGLPNASTAT